MPKISIITAAYIDSELKNKWLFEMVNSVTAQSFQDWELIVIDDKSPYRIEPFEFEDNRIRLMHNSENYGPAISRNTAVNQAVSSCLLPLDSDDKLHNPNVLENMYAAWDTNQSKVIYGNLQVMREDNTLSDIIDLGTYSFELAMQLKGTMPVTCMHSLDCHQRLGGWKSELEYGREDVEYWLNAGKLGFCGLNTGIATLIYRRHNESRDYKLKHVNEGDSTGNKEQATENQIRLIHKEIYEGNFPMGCCGGKGNNNVAVSSNNQNVQSQQFGELGLLPDVPEDQKMWVQYIGAKKGKWSIRGTTVNYTIHGIGYHFEAHITDFQRLRVMERGQAFVESSAPIAEEKEEIPVAVEMATINYPEIQVGTIERLDSMSMAKFGMEPVTVEIDPPVISANEKGVKDFINSIDKLTDDFNFDLITQTKELSLSDLDLGSYEAYFRRDGWTVEKIANAEPSQIQKYKGIGPTRAKIIIDKANQLIK